MAVPTKSLDRTVEKYVARAGVAQGDYVAGIQSPRRPWHESAIKGAANYKTAMAAVISGDRQLKGLQKVTDSDWRTGAAGKGANRFAEGVAAGSDKYRKNFGPILTAIGAQTLPDRGPRGSAANQTRMIENAKNIRAAAQK